MESKMPVFPLALGRHKKFLREEWATIQGIQRHWRKMQIEYSGLLTPQEIENMERLIRRRIADFCFRKSTVKEWESLIKELDLVERENTAMRELLESLDNEANQENKTYQGNYGREEK